MNASKIIIIELFHELNRAKCHEDAASDSSFYSFFIEGISDAFQFMGF